MASRNRTQICDSPSHGRGDGTDWGGLIFELAEMALLIRLLSGPGPCCYKHMTTEELAEVTEETEAEIKKMKTRAVFQTCAISKSWPQP
jgi:hypothetical protein